MLILARSTRSTAGKEAIMRARRNEVEKQYKAPVPEKCPKCGSYDIIQKGYFGKKWVCAECNHEWSVG